MSSGTSGTSGEESFLAEKSIRALGTGPAVFGRFTCPEGGLSRRDARAILQLF